MLSEKPYLLSLIGPFFPVMDYPNYFQYPLPTPFLLHITIAILCNKNIFHIKRIPLFPLFIPSGPSPVKPTGVSWGGFLTCQSLLGPGSKVGGLPFAEI